MAALEFLARPAIATLIAPHLTRESRKKLQLRRRRLSPQPGDQAPLLSQFMLAFGTETGLVRLEFRHLGGCSIAIAAIGQDDGVMASDRHHARDHFLRDQLHCRSS